MARRAMPAGEWRTVRKESVTKDVTTSAAVEESGKAPPAHITGREFPGTRTKMPPIVDSDSTEMISLPNKAGKTDILEPDRKACSCNKEITKCACQVDKFEAPVDATAGEANAEMKTKAEAGQPENNDAAGDDGPGVMLALWTPRELASKIAHPGGTDPNEMHCTLGYYGKVGKEVKPEHIETVTKCVAMCAKGYQPVKAHVGGVGRFNSSPSSGGKDVLVAHVDSPGLHDLRDHLIEHVQKCADIQGAATATAPTPTGMTPLRTHGYTPHMTMAYIDPAEPMPVHKLDRHEFTFTHLVLAVGDTKHVFPLGEQANVSKSFWMPIIKADDEERLATGIVLQPEVVDAQGDVIGADVIKQTAHNFLALYNKKTQLGLQHELMRPEGVELVESWVSPVDMIMNTRTILAGTWMMTVRVRNDALWAKIKTGALTGFSIGGVAKVQRLA